MLLGCLRNDLRHIGNARCRRLRPFGVRLFGLAHQLVRLFLRHLSATYHVLHEIARALDRESGETGSGTDDVLHCGGDLASRLLTDLLRTRRHLGDGVPNVGAAMSGGATGAIGATGAPGSRGAGDSAVSGLSAMAGRTPSARI